MSRMKALIFIGLFLALFACIQATQSTEYYTVAAGGVCNNEKDVIRSEKECTKALTNLGYTFKKRYWEGSKRRLPSGCSLRTRNNRPHLNNKPGVGRGRNDQIPICKAASCNDGLLNQGEDEVDCGGPCDACQTCSDGIQNQGEVDMDCGGPCPPCLQCSSIFPYPYNGTHVRSHCCSVPPLHAEVPSYASCTRISENCLADFCVDYHGISGQCVDTDNGILDDEGKGCIGYNVYPFSCGKHDDDDFVAREMCCVCGGGTDVHSAPNPYVN